MRRGILVAQGPLHYAGGALNIRDVLVPAPGSYLALYDYFYRSTQFNDQNGDKLTSFVVPTKSGQNALVHVNVDVFLTGIFPNFVWVSPWKILGGQYSAYVSPELANTNLNLAASTARNVAGVVSVGSFGRGDPLSISSRIRSHS